MAVIERIMDGKPVRYYIHKWTIRQLDTIKKLISKKDRDYVIVVDGEEGSGKSTLACQMAKYVDPSFTEDRMCLRPEDFMEKINQAKKGQAVVFDEAYTGLGSRSSLTVVNKMMVEMMMEMRQKNLFIIMCVPSVFYLERYVALHRARALFHVFFSGGRPGNFRPYNQAKLKWLYLVGKQKMSYYEPKVRTVGRFPATPVINWEKYNNKKLRALKTKETNKTLVKQTQQRDALFHELKKYHGYTVKDIRKALRDRGLDSTNSIVYEGIKRFEDMPKTLVNPN